MKKLILLSLIFTLVFASKSFYEAKMRKPAPQRPIPLTEQFLAFSSSPRIVQDSPVEQRVILTSISLSSLPIEDSNLPSLDSPIPPYSLVLEIQSYIIQRFGSHAPLALCIVSNEDGSYQTTRTHWNANGTWDEGIFQINEVHGYSMGYLENWQNNVDVAYKISGGWNFSAWSTYSRCN